MYWALRGVDVDAFYRLQAMIFGDGVDWRTIVCKVLVDQFVYTVYFGLLRLPRFFMHGWIQVFPLSDGGKKKAGRKSWILFLFLLFHMDGLDTGNCDYLFSSFTLTDSLV